MASARSWSTSALAGLLLAPTACENEAPPGPEFEDCVVCGLGGGPSCALTADDASDSCLEAVSSYQGATGLAVSAAWSPIDDTVLSGANGELRLLELAGEPATFRVLAVSREQRGRTFVRWSPDGHFALSASKDVRLLAIDRARGSIASIAPPDTGHSGSIYSLAFTPDGTHALTVGQDGLVRLLGVDTARGALEEVAVFGAHAGKVYDVSISPDGAFAALANQDGTARLLAIDVDGRALREVARRAGDGWVTAVSWSPDGGELLVGTWRPCDTVELFTVNAGATTLTPTRVYSGHPSGVRVVRFGPNGDWAATAGHDDDVKLFAVSDGGLGMTELATWDDDGLGVHDIGFSPDGTHLLVTASHRDRVTLIDASRCAAR